MARVLLINPPMVSPKGAPKVVGRHLGLAYIASALRQRGHDVEIVDTIIEKIDEDRLINLIAEKNPDLIGFTIYQGATRHFAEILSRLSALNLKSHITAGGMLPTLMAEELLKACSRLDSISMGEGEFVVSDLADAIAEKKDWTGTTGLAYRSDGKVIINPLRPLIHDLDVIPFPATDSLKLLHNSALEDIAIMDSRGCYGNCSFCHTPAYYRKFSGSPWRCRSAKNVVDEMESLIAEFPVKHISLLDDTFIGPGKNGRRFSYEVAQEIIERKLSITFSIDCRVNDVEKEFFTFLKEAGLKQVFLGIESINQETLDLYGKKVKVEQIYDAISILDELEIKYIAGYILFDPYAKISDLERSIAFWEELKEHSGNVTSGFGDRLFVLKGSKMESKLEEDGLMLSKDIFSCYDLDYKFQDTETQKVFDTYFKITVEVLYPYMEMDEINHIQIYTIHDYKMQILKKLIELNKSNNLNDNSIKFTKREAQIFMKVLMKTIT